MGYTAGQIITSALLEINAIAAGDIASADDSAIGLQKFNDLLDEWAARKVYAWTTEFGLFTLQAGLSPHLIGPTGTATFVQTQVPVKIVSAAFILNESSGIVDAPIIRIRDHAWWAAQQVKNLTTNVVTDLYYSPDQPNGSLFFWPVPSAGGQVRLEQLVVLAQLAALATTVILPPGYRQAFTLSLAERLCPAFEKEPSPSLMRSALLARKAIQGNNDQSPRIATADYGMPQTGGSRGRRYDFNWLTGNLG